MNEKAIVDADAVGEAIARAVRRAGVRTKEVAVAISGDAAITKVIQMPRNLNDSDLEAQVEMQADQYIPFPMDEVAYDFEVLGASEKDSRIDGRAAGGLAFRERGPAPRRRFPPRGSTPASSTSRPSRSRTPAS